MKSARRMCLLALTLCCIGLTANAQTSNLDSKTQAEIIDKITQLLRDNYVFPDAAEQAGKFVQSEQGKGVYANAKSPQDFAERLTHDLQNVTHDKHMRVFPAPPQPEEKDDEAARELRFVRQDARNNFGFVKVERLAGNVGYLDLRGFSPARQHRCGDY